MLVNAIEGVVENGQIRLREHFALPENATVYVIVADGKGGPAPWARVRTPRLADSTQAADFRKQVVELPPDAKL
jgi:hypothetical protein